jgi:hypothetical protein
MGLLDFFYIFYLMFCAHFLKLAFAITDGSFFLAGPPRLQKLRRTVKHQPNCTLDLVILDGGGFFFLAARGAFDHAVKHNDRRDALDNNHQGAETEEEQDQGAAYEDLVGYTR